MCVLFRFSVRRIARAHAWRAELDLQRPQTGGTFGEPAAGLNPTTANGKEAAAWEDCQGAPCLPSTVLIHSAVLPRVAREKEMLPVSLAPPPPSHVRWSKVARKG